MAQHVELSSTGRSRLSGRNDRGRPRPTLAALMALNAVAAWAGALGLVTGWLTLGTTVEERLPFDSPVLGGIALASVVAIPSTVVAILALRGDRRTDVALAVTGAMLVGWIVVQPLFIRELNLFHPTYLCVGALMIVVGWRGMRRQDEASAPSR
jgi:hypothetical protein